jgi:histidinol-phosphate aminotransferase
MMSAPLDSSFPTPPPREAVRRLSPYTPGEQPSDPDIVKLNTNEFPYPPAPEVVEAVRREAGEALRRYPNPTCAPLRQALAEECGVAPENILVGNGSDEILRLLFQAYIGPGDEVAVTDPTYSLYPVLAEMFEGRLATCAPSDGNLLGEEIFSAQARLFVVANPNPPLGTLYEAADLERLAGKSDRLLVIDEAYVAFAPRDCLALAREHPNVAISRTFSKSHGMAGLRVGYIVACREIIGWLDRIRDSYNVNRVSQAAALAALEARDYYAPKIREMVETRERLREELTSRGFDVSPSAANFLFARSGDGRRTMESLRKQGVLVRYFDEPGLRDGVRISVGTPQEIDCLLKALDNTAEQEAGR